VINFGENEFTSYNVTPPLQGGWRVRFNSGFKGYSPEFAETNTDVLYTTNDQGHISFPLIGYQILILTQDA